MVITNFFKEILPSIVDSKNYLRSAYNTDRNIRTTLIKHGLFNSTIELELAMCSCYTLARKLHKELEHDDAKLITIEPCGKVTPIMGLTIALTLGLKVHCVGDALQVPKLKNEFYTKTLELVTISTEPIERLWPTYFNPHVIFITYDPSTARAAWFRSSTPKGIRHLVFIGDESPKSMEATSADETSEWTDTNFVSCKQKKVFYWKDSTHKIDDTTPSEDERYQRHD